MTLAVKILLGAVVLLGIAGGAYWYVTTKKPPAAEQAATAPVSSGTEAPQAPNNGLPSGTATVDAALDQDLEAIDAGVNSFTEDNTTITQGLADKPLPQSSL